MKKNLLPHAIGAWTGAGHIPNVGLPEVPEKNEQHTSLQRIMQSLIRLILRLMRWSTLILGIICSSAATLMAIPSNGQSPLDKKVTVSLTKAPLATALKELETSSGIPLVYGGEVYSGNYAVSISARDWPVRKVLDHFFKGLPFRYKESSGEILVTYSPTQKAPLAKPVPVAPVIEDLQKDISGIVTDSLGLPLPGVTVQIKNSSTGTATDNEGRFILPDVPDNSVLVFRMVGFQTQEITMGNQTELRIVMKESIADLGEVIVSSGYQFIPQERVTGSFAQMDNDLVNRRVSTNALDRLEGVVSGVRFNTQSGTNSNESSISIRGRSTIFSNTEPLIVVDNFPYDGNLDNINPNDIESITVLRDAAAASIWGSRSSNGVIVITTKKGKYNQPVKVEINSNVTVGKRPDLFYSPNFVPTADFLEVESFLFSRGAYDAKLNNTTTRPVVSPVVEMFAQRRSGAISTADSAAMMNNLLQNDVRRDLSEYFYQKSISQQYSVNIRGGSDKTSYSFSSGYDNNRSHTMRNGYERLTLGSNLNFRPISKLEFTTSLVYTMSNMDNHNSGYSATMGLGGISMYPYAQLADTQGTPLAIVRDNRQSYKETAGNGLLLNWDYKPLEELYLADNTSKLNHLRLNTSLRYNFSKSLSGEFRYQYEQQTGLTRNHQSVETYFSRNLINRYSSILNNTFVRNIPTGGILDQANSELNSSRLRGQLNYDIDFGNDHQITAIAGIESGQIKTLINSGRLYGYNDENATSINALDYKTRFTLWENAGFPATIPAPSQIRELNDVNVSYYSNASYTFRKRYSLSASARIDQSNLFGVEFNQKSIPLWSVGGAWTVSEEDFFHVNWLPYLRLRSTFGYNGNVNKSVAALLTATYAANANEFGLFTATINNPANPNLQWERTGILNLAIDFGIVQDILSGSFEFYTKNSQELIGTFPVAASSGVTNFTGNVGSMKGKGFDLELRSLNLNRAIKWQTNLLLSYNRDEIVSYDRAFNALEAVFAGDGRSNSIIPYEGRPIYGVYSFRWGGLDNSGNPQGFLDNELSTNYSKLTSPSNLDDLKYHGSARPTYFGGLRNTLSYKGFSLSANLTFKLGYYFRASSIDYSLFFAQYGSPHNDIAKRWRNPGDEQTTDVPAMIYPANAVRDRFYNYSEALIHRGNHIRLQDITLDYAFGIQNSESPVKNLNIYLYANNLGIIWRANQAGIDPDFVSGFPNPQTIALGLKGSF